MHDPTAILTHATDAVAAIVEAGSDPLAETPCPEWTYAQLLGHLVGGDRMAVRILSGAGTAPTNLRLVPEVDQPPPTPADYRRWSGELALLLAEPATRAATHTLPVGELTGDQVIILRAVEHLLHGWDLAKAAGATTASLQAVAVALDRPARRLLEAVGDTTLADRRPFAVSVATDDDAAELEQLVAAFGRDPGWEPDPRAGYDRLKERFVGRDDVELPDGTRHGFGAEGMRVGNRVFATPHQGRLMIKLPQQEVDGLIRAGLGRPLAKPGQRPHREWVLVPFDGAAGTRADRAYAFLSGRG